MDNELLKIAGMEEAGMTDPRTGLPIRVSTTVRMKYRKYFTEFWAEKREVLYDLGNKQLNEIIAQDFAVAHNDAVHMFLSNSSSIASQRRSWIEVRKTQGRGAFNFFFSVIRTDGIDLITTSTKYYKPKKPRLFIP